MTDERPTAGDGLPDGVDLAALTCEHGCSPPTEVDPRCELHATDEPVVERYRRDTCPECNGAGYQLVIQYVDEREGSGHRVEAECDACDGTGWRGGTVPEWVADVPECLRERLGWTDADVVGR